MLNSLVKSFWKITIKVRVFLRAGHFHCVYGPYLFVLIGRSLESSCRKLPERSDPIAKE